MLPFQLAFPTVQSGKDPFLFQAGPPWKMLQCLNFIFCYLLWKQIIFYFPLFILSGAIKRLSCLYSVFIKLNFLGKHISGSNSTMYIVLSRIESDEKHCLPFLYEKKTANNVFQIYLFFVLLFCNRKKNEMKDSYWTDCSRKFYLI